MLTTKLGTLRVLCMSCEVRLNIAFLKNENALICDCCGAVRALVTYEMLEEEELI